MLKVTVAEVRRDIVKQMGIDLSASMNFGTAVVFQQQQSVHRQQCTARAGNGGTFGRACPVTATLRAMESAGVVRTLAEPNLTAISGEFCDLRLGGEFPIPTAYLPDDDRRRDRKLRADGQLQEVRHLTQLHAGRSDRGRISLRVMTEVSEVSTENALQAARRNDDSFDQDLPRGNHASTSLAARSRWRA